MEPLTVAMAEYNALRQEIVARLGYQSTAIFGCFSLVAIMIGLIAKDQEKIMQYRWIFPATSLLYFMMGWFILAQDRQIAEMGQYINTVLRPQINQLKRDSQWLLGWDTYIHSKDYPGSQMFLSSIRVGSLYGFTYVPGFCLFGIYIYLTIKCIDERKVFSWKEIVSSWEWVLIILNIVVIVTGIIYICDVFIIYGKI